MRRADRRRRAATSLAVSAWVGLAVCAAHLPGRRGLRSGTEALSLHVSRAPAPARLPPVEVYGVPYGLSERSELWAEPGAAARLWAKLQGPSPPGCCLHEGLPLRALEGLATAADAAALLDAAAFDPGRAASRRQAADLPGSSPVVQRIRHRISTAFGVCESLLEPLRLVQYSKKDDTFERHVDWTVDAGDSQLALLGQRIATGLLYLTDAQPDLGGETTFPRLGLSIRPTLGTCLLWPNVGPDGMPLEDSEHEAEPLRVDGAMKAAVNIWVRDRPLPTDERTLRGLFLS